MSVIYPGLVYLMAHTVVSAPLVRPSFPGSVHSLDWVVREVAFLVPPPLRGQTSQIIQICSTIPSVILLRLRGLEELLARVMTHDRNKLTCLPGAGVFEFGAFGLLVQSPFCAPREKLSHSSGFWKTIAFNVLVVIRYIHFCMR